MLPCSVVREAGCGNEGRDDDVLVMSVKAVDSLLPSSISAVVGFG